MTDYDALLPLADKIVVRRDGVSDRTSGGIHLPQTAQDRQRPDGATVRAVGPGRRLDNGELCKVDARVVPGVRVLFTRYSGSEVSIDGEDVLILRESDLLAIDTKGAETQQRDFKHSAADRTPTLRQHLGATEDVTLTERKSFPVS